MGAGSQEGQRLPGARCPAHAAPAASAGSAIGPPTCHGYLILFCHVPTGVRGAGGLCSCILEPRAQGFASSGPGNEAWPAARLALERSSADPKRVLSCTE